MIDEHVNRTEVKLTSFDEAEADDIEYWMSRTPTERVEAIEYLRRWAYGEAAVDAGVQRVLELGQLSED